MTGPAVALTQIVGPTGSVWARRSRPSWRRTRRAFRDQVGRKQAWAISADRQASMFSVSPFIDDFT